MDEESVQQRVDVAVTRLFAADVALGNSTRDLGFKPVLEPVIVKAEAQIGRRLPDDFRHFMMSYGSSTVLTRWLYAPFDLAWAWTSTVHPLGVVDMQRDLDQADWGEWERRTGLRWDNWHLDLVPFAFHPHDSYWCFDYRYDAESPPLVAYGGWPPVSPWQSNYEYARFMAPSFVEVLESTVVGADSYDVEPVVRPQSEQELTWLRARNGRLGFPDDFGVGNTDFGLWGTGLV